MPSSGRWFPSCKKFWREEAEGPSEAGEVLVAWPTPWLVLSCVGAKRGSPGGDRDAPGALLESGSTQGTAGCAMDCSQPQGRLLKSLFSFHDCITLVAPQSFPWGCLWLHAAKNLIIGTYYFFLTLLLLLCRCLLYENHVLECSHLLAWSSPYSCLSHINSGTFINMYL